MYAYSRPVSAVQRAEKPAIGTDVLLRNLTYELCAEFGQSRRSPISRGAAAEGCFTDIRKPVLTNVPSLYRRMILHVTYSDPWPQRPQSLSSSEFESLMCAERTGHCNDNFACHTCDDNYWPKRKQSHDIESSASALGLSD